MFKTTSKEIDLQSIVKINNTEELTNFIRNFIEESSLSVPADKTAGDKEELNSPSPHAAHLPSPHSLSEEIKSGPEKVSVSLVESQLGTIKQRLSHFISAARTQPPRQPKIPKSLRDGLQTEEDVKETISKIVKAAEQENVYQDQDDDDEGNIQKQIKIIQDHLNDDTDAIDEPADDQIVEVYVNGELVSQTSPAEAATEAAAPIGPENKVTWTLSAPQTPNAAMSPSSALDPIYYDEYEEYDTEDNIAEPSLLQPPHIVASSALANLNDLFSQHLPQQSSGSQSSNNKPLLPLELISKLQQSPVDLPESETLNIILTPGGQHRNHPNIAILPTSDLAGISSNISQDIGVDIEAILSSLAGSASKIRNQPMIVEENHTQLIKQPGRPTKMKIKETMSEILGDSTNPLINVLSNKEEENSFQDLETLIRQVTGEAVTQLPPNMPKGGLSFDDQLKLNVSTKTNIVNIFAFNIYPSGNKMTGEDAKYQIDDFSSVGTSIKTQANVLFQPPGEVPTHIESQYDYQSQPAPAPSKPEKSTIDAILGAVLLSQLEGGGSDRVIAALGQSPDMMAAILGSRPGPAAPAQPAPPPPSPPPVRTSAGGGGGGGGLYPEGAVDNLSEYSPGPYGTIARNAAIQKLILAMAAAERDNSPQQLAAVVGEMPEYAKLLLQAPAPPHSRTRASSSPLGPLGYPVSRRVEDAQDSAPAASQPKDPKDILESMGGSAAAALMAGAMVTYPYWLPLLAGGRRRRRSAQGGGGNPDISRDWLALLTGSKYTADTETLNQRLENWVTQSSAAGEGAEVQEETERQTSSSEDDIVPQRRLNEKVRVSLADTDTESVQQWRNNYIQQDKKAKPELYSNYYPSEEKKTKTQTNYISKVTTEKVSKITTPTTTTTTTTTTSTTTTTTSTTNNVKPSTFQTTVHESLLFWTTPRPKLSFRKPFRTTTSSTSTTTTTTEAAATTTTTPTTTTTTTTLTTASTASPRTLAPDRYWFYSSTLAPSPAAAGTQSGLPRRGEATPSPSSLISTPRSGFLWFTKKPLYNLATSESPVSSPSPAPSPGAAWWQQSPGNVIKVAAVISDSTSTTTKSVQVAPDSDTEVKPNFNNKYSYTQPITRTPDQKLSWEEKFKPVKATPLYQTEIIVEDPPPVSPSSSDFVWLDDVAPKSSIVNQKTKVVPNTNNNLGKVVQKEVDLPKWPYVENLWNKVDRIMVDLLEPEDIKANNVSNVETIFSSLDLDTSGLEQIENEALYNSLNPTTTNPTTTERPDQAYWQNLKKKYGFISAYTEHYPDKTTENPSPSFYNAKIPSLNEILLEAEVQSVTQPQVVDSSNSLYFDSTNQPPSEPYPHHPNILVAKRNISSSNDVLQYLNELMKGSGKFQDKENFDERETTMRSFFKPDLLPAEFSEDFPLLKEIDKVQESLGNNENFLPEHFNLKVLFH